jgi:fido (protein-threonine AMPylation protein)
MSYNQIDILKHQTPEIAEWGDKDILFLHTKLLAVKSKWKETQPEDEGLLLLGCALAWDKMVKSGRQLPELGQPPSYYRYLARKHRQNVKRCAEHIAPRAQAWGGFWDPEVENKEDTKGWAERKSSIAPHIWISLKKKEFLTNINSPLQYETESLRGLKDTSLHFLRKIDTAPSTISLLEGHKKLFNNISNEAGSFASQQLVYAGYLGSEPREIPWEIEKLANSFSTGIKAAKERNLYKEAEIIRWVSFATARLLRIHPFTSGNKRLFACWAICALHRELNKTENNPTKFWKNMHSDFISMRKGDIEPICKKLCIAFGVKNPQVDVPSFWLPPEDITPISIQKKRAIHEREKAQKNNLPKKLLKKFKSKKSEPTLLFNS